MAAVQSILAQLPVQDGLAAEHEVDYLANALKELKTNPVVVDLRSIALEALAALMLRSSGWEDVELGLLVPFQDTERDVDVHGYRSGRDECRLVECKAYHTKKELDPADVGKFFTETVPAFYQSLGDQKPKVCYAELWTTGIIGQSASDRFNSLQQIKGVEFRIVDHDQMLQALPRTLSKCEKLLEAISFS
jgi:hypothetical protein